VTNYSKGTSWIIAASNHPSIVKKRVEFGLLPSGEKDRNALDVMVGALPSAKGPTFIGKAIFGAGDRGISKDDEDEPETQQATVVFGVDDDLDQLFPPANTMQEKLTPIRQRLLEK